MFSQDSLFGKRDRNEFTVSISSCLLYFIANWISSPLPHFFSLISEDFSVWKLIVVVLNFRSLMLMLASASEVSNKTNKIFPVIHRHVESSLKKEKQPTYIPNRCKLSYFIKFSKHLFLLAKAYNKMCFFPWYLWVIKDFSMPLTFRILSLSLVLANDTSKSVTFYKTFSFNEKD